MAAGIVSLVDFTGIPFGLGTAAVPPPPPPNPPFTGRKLYLTGEARNTPEILGTAIAENTRYIEGTNE